MQADIEMLSVNSKKDPSLSSQEVSKKYIAQANHFTKSSEAQKLAILIDDDELIREVWKLEANKESIKLRTYSNITSFREGETDLAKGTPIYVDFELGEENGLELLKELNLKGFTSLHLITGYQKESFSSLPFIQSVGGKRPPFV